MDAPALAVIDPISGLTEHNAPATVPPVILFPTEERRTFVSGKPFDRSLARPFSSRLAGARSQL